MSRKDPSFPATVTIQTSEILEGFINYLFRNPWITAKRKQEAEGRSLVWNSSDTALSHALLPATGSDSSYPWNKQLIPTSRMGSAPEPAPNCHGFAATETSGKSLCSKKDLSRKKRTQECLGSGVSSDPEPSHGVKTELLWRGQSSREGSLCHRWPQLMSRDTLLHQGWGLKGSMQIPTSHPRDLLHLQQGTARQLL